MVTGVLAAGIVVAAGVLIFELMRPSDPKGEPPPASTVASQVPAVVAAPKAESMPAPRPEASPPPVARVETPAAPVAEKAPEPVQPVVKEEPDPFSGIVAAVPPVGFKARNYANSDREYEACYARIPSLKSTFDEIQRLYLAVATNKAVVIGDRCEATYRVAEANADLRASLAACSRFLVDDYVMTLAMNNTRAALAAGQAIGCAPRNPAPQPSKAAPAQSPQVPATMAPPPMAAVTPPSAVPAISATQPPTARPRNEPAKSELTVAGCKSEATAMKARLDSAEPVQLRVINDESRRHGDRCSAGKSMRAMNAQFLSVLLKCEKFLDNAHNIRMARERIEGFDKALKGARCS